MKNKFSPFQQALIRSYLCSENSFLKKSIRGISSFLIPHSLPWPSGMGMIWPYCSWPKLRYWVVQGGGYGFNCWVAWVPWGGGDGGWLRRAVVVGYASPGGRASFASSLHQWSWVKTGLHTRERVGAFTGVWWHLGCNAVGEMVTIFI